MNKRHIITVCGVIVGLSLMFVAGTAAGQNASDYPPIDVDTEVQELDENDSVNSTVGLDHARGYDSEAVAVWDCSVGDCSSSNLSAFAGGGTLEVVSKNNMTVSRNADGWEFTTNGTNPSVIVEANWSTTPSNNSSTFSHTITNGQLKTNFDSAFGSAKSGTIGFVANGSHRTVYQNGSVLNSVSQAENYSNFSWARIKWTENGSLSDVSTLDDVSSDGEMSLLADEYRVGAFVPDQQTTTGRNLGENQSLTWNVSNLRDSEVTLKTQYYDGSNWVTDQELTVSNAGEFDVAVNNPGNEYRYITEPKSTVDSGGGGGFFTGGSGSNVLYIFGISINRSTAMGGAGVFLILFLVAAWYPGMKLFGRGSDN